MTPFTCGVLQKRYQRFLADVLLPGGEVVTVACPNTGALRGAATPGMRVGLSAAQNPLRRCRWTWECTEVFSEQVGGLLWVGVNTHTPNRLVWEGVRGGFFSFLGPEFESQAQRSFRKEVAYGQNSRVDFFLESSHTGRSCFLEVKNVHFSRTPGRAEFPDSVTTRGVKHLKELSEQAQNGARALVLYVLQRNDCTHLTLAQDIDPTYAQASETAREAGVEFWAVCCAVSLEGVVLSHQIPMQF